MSASGAPPMGDVVVDGVYRALPDAATDRVFAVVSALIAEVWTVRDRLRLVEGALADNGIDVDAWVAAHQSEDDLALMRADRDAFVERVLRAVVPAPAPSAPRPGPAQP